MIIWLTIRKDSLNSQWFSQSVQWCREVGSLAGSLLLWQDWLDKVEDRDLHVTGGSRVKINFFLCVRVWRCLALGNSGDCSLVMVCQHPSNDFVLHENDHCQAAYTKRLERSPIHRTMHQLTGRRKPSEFQAPLCHTDVIPSEYMRRFAQEDGRWHKDVWLSTYMHISLYYFLILFLVPLAYQ